MEIKITEAEVKKGIEDYLHYQMNLGKLWYARLNVGDIFIPNKDGSHRSFKGVEKGTADYIVIQCQPLMSIVTFIEVKSSKGKQSPDQVEFEKMIIKFNCRYAIVRSVDELEVILN